MLTISGIWGVLAIYIIMPWLIFCLIKSAIDGNDWVELTCAVTVGITWVYVMYNVWIFVIGEITNV